MGYNRSSLIKGTCISPGTGSVSIFDTVGQPYLSWKTIPDTSIVHYAILDQVGTNCEFGRGTKGGGTSPTLARDHVIGGSGGAGIATNFSTGTQDVYICAVGEENVFPNSDTDPTVASSGQIYFNDIALRFRVYDGNVWRDLPYSSSNVGDLNYTFTQSTPSSSWTVVHNLGKFPSVRVMDSANEQIEGDVTDINADSLTIDFTAPFSGVVYLN